jgi:hypothetical protein
VATRLGLYGGPRSPYGDFSLKGAASGTKSFTSVFTRHGLHGGPRKPYGSFAGKEASEGTKPFTSVWTRHGLHGGPRIPYGSFEGKLPTEIEEVVTSSGGFYARPTQEQIDKWLLEELDPSVSKEVRERVRAKVLLPQIEVGTENYENLEAQREAIERLGVPLMPSQIEKAKSGVVSIEDLLPDYNLDEMDEEAIVLLMMMRM